jgi:hypothetical protein
MCRAAACDVEGEHRHGDAVLLSHQARLPVDRALQDHHVTGSPAGEIDQVARDLPGAFDRAERGAGEAAAVGGHRGAGVQEADERFGDGHPRFHAWVNSPPDRAGLLADLLASAADPSCAGGNHAGVQLERMVIRWLAGLLGIGRRNLRLLASPGRRLDARVLDCELAAARRRDERPRPLFRSRTPSRLGRCRALGGTRTSSPGWSLLGVAEPRRSQTGNEKMGRSAPETAALLNPAPLRLQATRARHRILARAAAGAARLRDACSAHTRRC